MAMETVTARPARPRLAADALPSLVRLDTVDPRATVHYLRLREVVVGRAHDADLCIDHPSISRYHAKFVQAGEGIVNLLDLESKNGTRVNGVRVGLTVLREGDVVLLGDIVMLRFAYIDPATKAEPPPLTARQLAVAQLVALGLTNIEVADRLDISPRTVATHLDHIYERLGIGTRTALTRYLADHGLLDGPG